MTNRGIGLEDALADLLVQHSLDDVLDTLYDHVRHSSRAEVRAAMLKLPGRRKIMEKLADALVFAAVQDNSGE